MVTECLRTGEESTEVVAWAEMIDVGDEVGVGAFGHADECHWNGEGNSESRASSDGTRFRHEERGHAADGLKVQDGAFELQAEATRHLHHDSY